MIVEETQSAQHGFAPLADDAHRGTNKLEGTQSTRFMLSTSNIVDYHLLPLSIERAEIFFFSAYYSPNILEKEKKKSEEKNGSDLSSVY